MARITFLLLLLWVGVTVSTVVDLQKRIYGGKDCDPDERLYHVGLSISATGDNIHCGGSRIHEQWVLTAAHCKKDTMYAVVGVHPGPGNPVIIQEKHIYLNHDIMLLKLPSNIPGSKNILISMPDDGECKFPLKTGEVVGVAGHGDYEMDTATGESIPGQPTHLQCATLKVVTCDMTKIRTYHLNEPADNWLCAKDDHMAVCPGDSGGGVEYKGKLHGVIIGGDLRICRRHADFLNVCKYTEWIKKTIKGK